MQAYLMITDGNSEPRQIELDATGSLFAGSGSNCRLSIEGAGVQEIHCRFWFEKEGQLIVQDWNTGTTKVNGNTITDDVELKSGDAVLVGGNLIVPVLTLEFHDYLAAQGIETGETAPFEESIPAEYQPPELTGEPTEEPVIDEPVIEQSALEEVETPQTELDDLLKEVELNKFVYDADAVDNETEEARDLGGFGFPLDTMSSFGSGSFDETEPMDQEEANLLRMEVEQLRYELAERDSQFTNRADVRATLEPQHDEDQTVQLVNRLEELLGELQHSDDRVRGLEELLRVSDQATQAEREERQQLESWVNEIEQRVIQRESESEAEVGRMTKRLNDAKTQFQDAESKLKKVIRSQGGELSEKSSELIESLGKKVTELQDNLTIANQENDELREQAVPGQVDPATQQEMKLLEQKLMQVQVEASQERAEMSRRRAELELLKDELQEKLAGAKDVGTADTRIQAMRQHLREIHEEEKTEKEEQKRNSLGGRISRLLTRVGQ